MSLNMYASFTTGYPTGQSEWVAIYHQLLKRNGWLLEGVKWHLDFMSPFTILALVHLLQPANSWNLMSPSQSSLTLKKGETLISSWELNIYASDRHFWRIKMISSQLSEGVGYGRKKTIPWRVVPAMCAFFFTRWARIRKLFTFHWIVVVQYGSLQWFIIIPM